VAKYLGKCRRGVKAGEINRKRHAAGMALAAAAWRRVESIVKVEEE